MASATLHALALPADRAREAGIQPAQGYLRPLVGPFENVVAAISGQPAPEVKPGVDAIPSGAARAEAVAVLLLRRGADLTWGEPVVPSSAREAEAFAYARGRSSVEIGRADPSLVSELQVGGWFTAGWRGRLLRPLLVRIPWIASLIRLVVRHPMAMKLSIDIWFWAGVKSRASRWEWQRLTRSSYVMFCYHQLSAERLGLTRELHVGLRRFRRQVKLLQGFGYRPLTQAELINFHQDPNVVLDRRRYVVTADDGYVDAVKTLQEYPHSRPVVFVVTEFAARARSWQHPVRFASWEDLIRASRSGVVLGAHGRRHVTLVDCDPPSLQDEVAGARSDFQAAGLEPPLAFAYPYGRHDHSVREAAIAAGYAVALTTEPGRNGAGTDPWCLRRITIEPDDGPLAFLWKVLTGEPLPTLFERLRRCRRRRHLGSTV